MSDSDFELTVHDVLVNVWISTGAAAVSLVLCCTVLGLAYYVWSRPHTRPMIDRISFRLLLWSVAFEVVYDVAYILVEMDTAFGLGSGICTSSLYFMIAAMTIVNYLCTAIAVNLMLTITFHVNPVRLGLEKWYIGLSLLIGIMVPLVPAATGHFRNDPMWGTCWVSADSLDELMKRIVLDLYLWQILSCAIATIAVIITLVTLFRQGRELSAALFAGNELNQSIFGQSSPDMETGSEEVEEKPRKWLALAFWRRKRCTTKEPSLRSQLEDKFLTIAFQISLYPISLILVNGIISIGELIVTRGGSIGSRGIYALYCIYYFLYGGRGIAFAALAFFIDPCFRRALGEAWRTRHERTFVAQPTDTSRAADDTKQSFAEMLATLTPILPYNTTASATYNDSQILSSLSADSSEKLGLAPFPAQSSSSFDMPAALTTLSLESPIRAAPHQPLVSTRSFVGVPPGHLPLEITDDIDVVAAPQPAAGSPAPPLLPSAFRPAEMTGLGVKLGEDAEKLEPLTPDLPDEREEERLRLRAAAEKKKAEEEREKAEMEETLRVFFAAKAML